MIRHVVAWKLKAEDADARQADAEGIATRLGALMHVVPGIVHLQVGIDLGETEGNADVVLVSDHTDREALAAYQEHPAHLEAVTFVKSVVASRAAVDFEL